MFLKQQRWYPYLIIHGQRLDQAAITNSASGTGAQNYISELKLQFCQPTAKANAYFSTTDCLLLPPDFCIMGDQRIEKSCEYYFPPILFL